MCWTLNNGRKIVPNPAPEDRLQTSASNWKPTEGDQYIGDANLNRKHEKWNKSQVLLKE